MKLRSLQKNANCVNSDGSFECVCFDGFKGDACDDIDECREECLGSHRRYSGVGKNCVLSVPKINSKFLIRNSNSKVKRTG